MYMVNFSYPWQAHVGFIFEKLELVKFWMGNTSVFLANVLPPMTQIFLLLLQTLRNLNN